MAEKRRVCRWFYKERLGSGSVIQKESKETNLEVTHDLSNVFFEPHINHSIGLVQTQIPSPQPKRVNLHLQKKKKRKKTRGSHLQASNVNRFLESMSINRPGVATTIWRPFESTFDCSCIEIPPIVSSTPRWGYPPSARAVHISWTPSYVCRANSRCLISRNPLIFKGKISTRGKGQGGTYRRTDDHPYRSFPLDEWHLSFLLERKHDRR